MTNNNQKTESIEFQAELTELGITEGRKWDLNTEIMQIRAYLEKDNTNENALEIRILDIKEEIEELDDRIEVLRKTIYGKLPKFVTIGGDRFERLAIFTKYNQKYAIYCKDNEFYEEIYTICEHGFINEIQAMARHFLTLMRDPSYQKLPLAMRKYC